MPKPARTRTAAPPLEVIDPRWILKALGLVLGVSILCAYITACALFYRSQWQLAISPSRVVTRTPAAAGLPFMDIRFGTDASGQPQLTGWWIPAEVSGALTALVLHAGTGSLSDALPQAQLLHAAGLNVFVFDYRGFGQSGGQHPTQALMQQDAVSALRYLTETRLIPTSQIVVFGRGTGASLAVQLCAEHPEIRRLILEDADGDVDRRLSSDPRASLFPARMLFHETFPLSRPLGMLATPKLLLVHDPIPQSARQAAEPKTMVALPINADPTTEVQSVKAFLTKNN